MPITTDNTTVTRVNNDSNGNPRIVIHWLELLGCESLSQWDAERQVINGIAEKGLSYNLAQSIASNAGFKKYHNKQYGGGLVVQCYNTQDSLDSLQYACEVFVAENTSNQALTDHVLSCIDLSEYGCKNLHKIIKSEKRVTRLNSRVVEDWLRGLPSGVSLPHMNHEQKQICRVCGLVGWNSDMYWRYAAWVILSHKV